MPYQHISEIKIILRTATCCTYILKKLLLQKANIGEVEVSWLVPMDSSFAELTVQHLQYIEQLGSERNNDTYLICEISNELQETGI